MARRSPRRDREWQYKSPLYRRVVKRLSGNVRHYRHAHGLTQEQAAQACKMPVRSYQDVEYGITNATMTTVARLCHGLEVDVAQLFERR